MEFENPSPVTSPFEKRDPADQGGWKPPVNTLYSRNNENIWAKSLSKDTDDIRCIINEFTYLYFQIWLFLSSHG